MKEDHSPGVTVILLGILAVFFHKKIVNVTPLSVILLACVCVSTISLVDLTKTRSSSVAIAQSCLIVVIVLHSFTVSASGGEHTQISGAFFPC